MLKLSTTYQVAPLRLDVLRRLMLARPLLLLLRGSMTMLRLAPDTLQTHRQFTDMPSVWLIQALDKAMPQAPTRVRMLFRALVLI